MGRHDPFDDPRVLDADVWEAPRRLGRRDFRDAFGWAPRDRDHEGDDLMEDNDR